MPSPLSELARAAGRIALDTEFVAERRYQAMLCLAQVAVREGPDGDAVRTEILDPLEGDDTAALAAALADPAIQVVVHAGRQDVAIVKRTWRTPVVNLFDTQIAAGFLGYGLQESYQGLVRRVLGVSVGGGESFTRWDRRPLTPEQLHYAREDARHLLELGEALTGQLTEAGRLEWAQEEFRRLAEATDERDPATVFERLPRAGRLSERARAVAMALVEWREGSARELDRNPGSLLPDHVLVELARRPPADRAALADARGLPEATRHRHGAELVAAVARGSRRPPPPPPPTPARTSSQDAPLTALLGAVVRARSLESGIAAQLVATQDELAGVVAAVRRGQEPEAEVLSGWRRALVGDELLAVLAGRRSVAVGEGRRLVLRPAGPETSGPQAAG